MTPRLRAPNCLTKEESIARRKAAQRAHYQRNKEQYQARARLWRERNPDAVAARRAEYKPSQEVIDRANASRKAWRARNQEYERQRKIEYRAANKDKVRHHRAIRRASLMKAKPPWLTKDQKRQIVEVYAEAIRLTNETGVQHHVDHIVPLRGKTVCGLHVPWNLRAIPADVNQRRPRIWRGEDQDAKDTSVATQGRKIGKRRPKRKRQSLLQPGQPRQARAQSSATRGRRAARQLLKCMKEKLTSEKTAKDPNSRINKSLRAWNC